MNRRIGIICSCASALLLAGLLFVAPVRIAFAAGAEPVQQVIAVCDVNLITNQLMDSKRFGPERAEQRKTYMDKCTAQQQKLKDLFEQLNALPPKDARRLQVTVELLLQRQNFDDDTASFRKNYDEFRRKQYIEAYELAKNAAIDIAHKRGYIYLLQSDTSADKLALCDSDFNQASDMLGRVALAFPKDVDITSDVKADLHLE